MTNYDKDVQDIEEAELDAILAKMDERDLAETRVDEGEFTERHLIADGSECRTMTVDGSEVRFRMGGSGIAEVSGHAALFNKLSEPLGGTGGSFLEKIATGAFRDSLNRGDDVVGVLNHDPEQLLGATYSNTLRLKEDSQGLFFSLDMPNTSLGRDTLEQIRRGDIRGLSFRFRNPTDDWESRSDGSRIRTLKSIGTLQDISLLTVPGAYKGTSVQIDRESPNTRNLQQIQSDERSRKLRLLLMEDAQLADAVRSLRSTESFQIIDDPTDDMATKTRRRRLALMEMEM